MAVGAVAAEEEEQDMVAAQGADGLAAPGRLKLVEHLQSLRVHRASLERGVELGAGPCDALRHVGEGGCARHHLGLQLHVAAHVGFGRPHDGDVPALLEGLLQALELDDLGGLCGQTPGCSGGARCRCGLPRCGSRWFGRRDLRLLVEVPAAPVVGPVRPSGVLRLRKGNRPAAEHDNKAECESSLARGRAARRHGRRLTTATAAAGRRGSS